MKITHKVTFSIVIITELIILFILYLFFYPGVFTKEFSMGEYSIQMKKTFEFKIIPRKDEYKQYSWKTPFSRMFFAKRDKHPMDKNLKRLASKQYPDSFVKEVKKSETPLVFIIGKKNKKGGYYIFTHRNSTFYLYSLLGDEQITKWIIDDALLSLKYKNKKVFNISRKNLKIKEDSLIIKKTIYYILLALAFPPVLVIAILFIINLSGRGLPDKTLNCMIKEDSVEVYVKKQMKNKMLVMSYAAFEDRIEFYMLKNKVLEIYYKQVDPLHLKIKKALFFSNKYVNVITKDTKIHIYSKNNFRLLNYLKGKCGRY